MSKEAFESAYKTLFPFWDKISSEDKTAVCENTVSVSYKKIDGDVKFNIFIPEGCHASFCIPTYKCVLYAGENEFSVSCDLDHA